MAWATTELTKERKDFIETQAEYLLKFLGYNDDNMAQIDTVQSAIKLGFNVVEQPMSCDLQGIVSINEKQHKKNILLNDSYNLDVRRFILAHELGHYILHKPSEDCEYHREDIKGKGIEEQEADYFAACFLMPKKYFKTGYEKLKGHNLAPNLIISVLAMAFRVPTESARRRIAEVN